MSKRYTVIVVAAFNDKVGDRWSSAYLFPCRYSGKDAKAQAVRLADFGAPYPSNVLILKKRGIKGWRVSAILEGYLWD